MKTRPTHEIGCGGNDALMMAVDIATDVNNLVSKEDAGSNTKLIATQDSSVGSNPVVMSSIGCQNITKTQDAGSDSMKTTTSNVGTQNERDVKDTEVSCEIIIPDEEESIQQESVSCFKCLGSATNKKGLPCRKCNGTGVLRSKEITEIVQIVREEVREYCTAEFKTMFKEYLVKKQADQRNTVFNRVICDGCGMTPIRGVRFMCSVCSDYDLCENCEFAGVHAHHPLLKVRKPEHAPSKLVCQYKASQHEFRAHEPKMDAKVESKMSASAVSKASSKGEKIIYKARFVKESIPDMYEVAPGAAFTKTWTMRNDGETAWPEDVVLIQTNGDNLGANPIALETLVPSQGEYDWTLNLKAPETEGKYCAFFRMAFGDNVRFGHKIWCMVLVKKPEVEAKPVPGLAM